MEYISVGEAETEALGRELAVKLRSGVSGGQAAIAALYGGLGAGKTAFIRGMAAALGYEGRVTSPTYTVVNEYQRDGKPVLIHFDMYRLSGSDDLYAVGWDDYLAQDAVIALEWADIVEDALEPETVRVYIEGSGDEPRKIKILWRLP